MDASRVVLIATALLSLLIVALSLVFFYESFVMSGDRLAALKDGFDLAVSKVLLSMFTTVVTALLTYIFGKQLVSALAERIRATGKSEGIRH